MAYEFDALFSACLYISLRSVTLTMHPFVAGGQWGLKTLVNLGSDGWGGGEISGLLSEARHLLHIPEEDK